MRKEWPRLYGKRCWDETEPLEWGDVRRRANRDGRTCHMGYLLGLCAEKGSELPPGDTGRNCKGRAVFSGDRVVDQN